MAEIPPGIDPTKVPFFPPPEGQTSNLINPANRIDEYYIVAGVCTALMTFFVAMRLYVRLKILRKPWWDDATVVIALLSQVAYTAVIIEEGKYGLGKHSWDVTLADALEYLHYAIPSAILTAPAIYFTKLTLLLLYLRLFSLNAPVKLGIWVGIVVCTAYYTAALFLFIFIKSTDTIGLEKLTYSVAVVGVITDVYIICLPLFAVASLHLNAARKWRVAAVFLTGLLSVVMSFLGCVYRFHLDADDSTYSLIAIYIVNTVEVDIGIICTCLPVMAALFKDVKKESWWLSSYRSLRDRLFTTRGSSQGSKGSGGLGVSMQTIGSASNRFPYGRQKSLDQDSDNIELTSNDVPADALPEQDATKAIWQQTTIHQKWEDRGEQRVNEEV